LVIFNVDKLQRSLLIKMKLVLPSPFSFRINDKLFDTISGYKMCWGWTCIYAFIEDPQQCVCIPLHLSSAFPTRLESCASRVIARSANLARDCSKRDCSWFHFQLRYVCEKIEDEKQLHKILPTCLRIATCYILPTK
jgi:hypothetical protein